jgi:transcriptional regulator with XRE-family HTH domain
MKRKRLAAKMTIDQAAEVLEWSKTKISNIETGRRKTPAVTDIRLLLDVYGVTEEAVREYILTLARKSRERGWWARYDDVIAGPYTSLEQGADHLRLFEVQYIPGLFQTKAYAEAISRATLIRDPADIERLVEVRMRRQEILDRDEPPEVWAIIHEAALLLARSAGPDLFREQLDRLIRLAEEPTSVTIQILPFQAGFHPGMGGPFVIMDYEDDAQSIAFLETNTDGLYLEKPAEVARYRRAFDWLQAKAIDPDDVPRYLRSLSV